MIRVQRILDNEFMISAKDSLLAWPNGAVAIWPSGFDYLLAGFAYLFGKNMLWFVPPLIGSCLPPLVFFIFQRYSGYRIALYAGIFSSLLPAYLNYSFAGRIDHHCLEPLIPMLAIAFLDKKNYGAILFGLLLGFMHAFSPSAIVISLSIIIPFTLFYLSGWTSVFINLGFTCGLSVSLFFSPHPFSWVFYSPSLLHLAFGVLFLSASLSAQVAKQGMLIRLGLALLAIGLMTSFFLIISPSWLESVTEGIKYVADNKIAKLSYEATPLFSDLERAFVLLTYLAPLSLIGFWKTIEEKNNRVFAIIFIELLFLSIAQRRFLVLFTPFFAFMLAKGLSHIWDKLCFYLQFKGVRKGLSITLYATLVLIGSLPSIRHLFYLKPITPLDRAMIESGNIPFQPKEGHQGILVPWSYGHLIQYLTNAPTVCDNFYGTDEHDQAIFACFRILLETNFESARRELERYKIGRIILPPPDPKEIKIGLSLLGMMPDLMVSEDGKLKRDFFSTFWGRLGIWGLSAGEGDTGMFGLRLVKKIVVRDKSTGFVKADVLVFDL